MMTRFAGFAGTLLRLGRYALVLVAACACGPVEARDAPADRQTLKGISAVDVVVEDLTPDAKNAGLSERQVQVDTELALRTAGIRVSSHAEATLYVNVFAIRHSEVDAILYFVEVAVHQMALLKRDPSTAVYGAPTWDVAAGGYVPEGRFAETVRREVSDGVRRFANAYLSVNPKGG